jgi:hypothetical protein
VGNVLELKGTADIHDRSRLNNATLDDRLRDEGFGHDLLRSQGQGRHNKLAEEHVEIAMGVERYRSWYLLGRLEGGDNNLEEVM